MSNIPTSSASGDWKVTSLYPEEGEYTKVRRFYAWIGFLALLIATSWSLWALSQANVVIEVVNAHNEAYAAEMEVSVPTLTPMNAVVVAYTSDPAETDDSPFITASNTRVRHGIVANNCFDFGTKVAIGDSIYEVQDRMNSRYGCDVFDIWMETKAEAYEWGRQRLTVFILDYSPYEDD